MSQKNEDKADAAEARTGWESYRAWYRNDRLHQALWYKSPRDYAKIARESNLLGA